MSSRIIVKNLPRRVKEARLQELFSKHGDISQVKLLSKRRFAYVGFLTEEAAKAAVEYRNDTFIDATKIEVSLALPYGHDDLPRPWSKYSAGSSAYKLRLEEKAAREQQAVEAKAQRVARTKEHAATHVERERALLQRLYEVEASPAENTDLKEFLEVMRPAKGKRTWADDGALGANKRSRGNSKKGPTRVQAVLKHVAGRRPGGENVVHVQKHLTFDDSDDEYQDMDDNKEEDENEAEDATGNEMALDTSVSDMEYLRSKMKPQESAQKKGEGSGAAGSSDAEDAASDESSDEGDKDATGSSDSDSGSDSSSDSDGESADGSPGRKTKRRRVDGAEQAAAEGEPEAAAAPKVFSVRMRGLPFTANEDNVVEFFHPMVPLDIRMPRDRQKRPSGRAYVDFATKAEYREALRRHKDFMGDRYVEVTPEVDGPPQLAEAPPKEERKFPLLDNCEESIAESGRIFVRNLAYAATEDDLRALFSPFGTLSECTLPIDKETQRSKAIAFVSFLLPEQAVNAYSKLDGTTFQGRLIHLLPAKPRHDEESGVVENIDETSYKKKREAKRKAQSQSSFNWNTLFLRSDTVADAMAAKYGVPKSQILDPEGDSSMAVRMALGESHVVAENKEFLAQHGVVLNAFDTRVQGRSDSVILVKNLPFEVKLEDLRNMFEKHGTLGRVVLPPSNTMALVEFVHNVEARKAFRSLAYRRIKNEPLYLEWAPNNVFSEKEAGEDEVQKPVASRQAVALDVVEEEDDADTTSVFVKNLNFQTTEAALRTAFEQAGGVRSVKIAVKRSTKNPGETLSLGFGFVEYRSRSDAMEALRTLQDYELEGHQLELKLSDRQTGAMGQEAKAGGQVKAKGTKLLVRNVAFEATKKELRELFAAFGQVKSVRLPLKFDGTHRGFAFVDFTAKEEAKKAFEAVSGSTHLYGRRLVLSFAKNTESVEDLQSKTLRDVKRSKSSRENKRLARKVDEFLA